VKHPQVLVIGLGGLGSWILELLARTDGISYVVGADFHEDWGRSKIHTVASGAVLQGYYPRLEFVRIDLQDVDATAETISRLKPLLILNCATLQTWWVRYQQLPPDKAKRLGEAGPGPWLPTHMALARKLMLAIRTCGWQGFVINSGYADCSNMVLAKRGLAPTIGLGNTDLILPGIQIMVAERLGVPVRNVSVYAVLHHYHYRCFSRRPTGAPPYFLRAMVGDRDVTGQFDTDQLLYEAVQIQLHGEHLNPVVAASGVKNALALLLDTGLLTHSPGPQGLPGAYPVRLSAAGAEVFLPVGITLEEAVAINKTAQRGDGIQQVEDDGTVVYTEKAIQALKEVLDYDLAPLSFDECDERARELIGRFKTHISN
jgi:hypothetical protein